MTESDGPYQPPRLLEHESQRAYHSRLGMACFWIAVVVWWIPLLISWLLFLLSFGNPENLGFWAITRNGPINVSSQPASELWIYALPIVFDLTFAAVMIAIQRTKRFRWSVPVLVAVLGWFVWGIFVFLDGIHIA